MNGRTTAEAAVLRLREGDLRAAAALGAQALAVAPADPHAAAAALLVAAVSGDGALVRDLDAAAVWEATLAAGDADATAFFGGAYASTIGDAFGAREILAAVFRRTPSAAASIEALLAAAGSGDRALQAAVTARIESMASDAPPGLRAAGEHAAATIAQAGGNHEEARRLATRAQRGYERAGWAYYAAKAAELAGDVRAARRAYRRFGAARDAERLAAGEHIAHDALAALTAREREVAALVAAGLANKEIAAGLGISVKTVEKNVTAIYAKLGIVRRVQLARLFAPKRERDTQRGNIGDARTPFFGRRAELAELRERALRHRLLSLVGPGGSGKTRLATELAQRLADLHSGGVWFIDLAGVATPAAVWPFVAATLGVPRDPQRSLDAAVCRWLDARVPLLVLDNAEHLLPDIARVVNALLEAGPGVRIIVTSRERVGVFGENVFRVGSMQAIDGLGFFREKAVAAGARVDDEQLAAAICERLDRIPLAIELAAARLYELSVPELAAAIVRHVPVLATADVGIPARHHSIDALVEWGYAPLPPPAQRAFRHAAVFAGNFPLAAALAVLGPGARADLARSAR
jgi:DNA-binding CsgD family transcriptional regulator